MQIRDFIVIGLTALLAVMVIALGLWLIRYLKAQAKTPAKTQAKTQAKTKAANDGKRV